MVKINMIPLTGILIKIKIIYTKDHTYFYGVIFSQFFQIHIRLLLMLISLQIFHNKY